MTLLLQPTTDPHVHTCQGAVNVFFQGQIMHQSHLQKSVNTLVWTLGCAVVWQCNAMPACRDELSAVLFEKNFPQTLCGIVAVVFELEDVEVSASLS